ncbi:MAG: ABC transporter substrate-binding protein [Desulfobulbaceae bacterium]|nr:MAG: ABC transporter substrate-binding protein [Desulfobulbaceae bacterium]
MSKSIGKYKLLPVFLTLLLLISMGFTTQVKANESGGPSGSLKPVLDELISILSDDGLKGDNMKVERRQKIMSSIASGFDFREMSRRVLGRTWNGISEEQKDYFVLQMTKLLENVYIGKLESYSGQTVEFVGERIKGNRAQVTTLIENNGAKLPVHYIMQKAGTTWMVYDINIEGVSLIRNYMEQFKSILRNEQFEGLIKVIEEKNKSFL